VTGDGTHELWKQGSVPVDEARPSSSEPTQVVVVARLVVATRYLLALAIQLEMGPTPERRRAMFPPYCHRPAIVPMRQRPAKDQSTSASQLAPALHLSADWHPGVWHKALRL